MFKLENTGQYQGYHYKLLTQKASRKPGYGFVSMIEIGGVKQDAPLKTKANAYEAHQDGLRYLKQFIDAAPVPKKMVNQW